MRICIVGGGNIGTALATYVKKNNRNHFVSIFTSRPGLFSEVITCNDWERDEKYSECPDLISDKPAEAAKDAEVVIIALPHFAVEKAFSDVAPFVSKNAYVGVFPGGGGCEFYFGKYFTDGHTLFGIQRVPFTAKLVEYGKEVNLKSWKPFSVVGTLKPERIDAACEIMGQLGLPTRKADNYLSIALTPTNPILHTSRIYEMFGEKTRDYVFAEKPKFYVGWNDKTSDIMLKMDGELQNMLAAITEMDTSAIRPLKEHYEAPSREAMTEKINSIQTFQSVYAPMRELPDGGYVADTDSRMFTEDFPWGLLIIRSYFDYFEVSAPMIDEVLLWFSQYMGLDWYANGELVGKDLYKTGIISKYGIKTREELLDCYR